MSNGRMRETDLPIGLNNKYISHIVDEFQININSMPSSDSGYVFIGDAGGGGDIAGGDAGGGGDAG